MQALIKQGTPKLMAFDLDGTLVDSVPDLANAVNATLADLKLQPHDQNKYEAGLVMGPKCLLSARYRVI